MSTTISFISHNHGWGMSGWNSGWMWLWGALMILAWSALVAGGVWLIVRATRSGGRDPRPTARAILDERLARGEITPEEHHQRRELIE